MTTINDDLFCNFIYMDDYFECSKCGAIVYIVDSNPEPPLWPCSNPVLRSTNTGKDILDFMNNHSRTNLTDEGTINYRHSICKSCDFFENNSCSKCGCAITKDRNYINKLATQDESCPISKW
jgi:hypothetical protein